MILINKVRIIMIDDDNFGLNVVLNSIYDIDI